MNVCAVCGGPREQEPLSEDFCSEACQLMWGHQRIGEPPPLAYREPRPSDYPPADPECPACGQRHPTQYQVLVHSEGGTDYFADAMCTVHQRHRPCRACRRSDTVVEEGKAILPRHPDTPAFTPFNERRLMWRP